MAEARKYYSVTVESKRMIGLLRLKNGHVTTWESDVLQRPIRAKSEAEAAEIALGTSSKSLQKKVVIQEITKTEYDGLIDSFKRDYKQMMEQIESEQG
jgi:hypothetical protein